MENKQNKIWLITYIVVAVVLVAGVILFVSQTQKDEESFPELSLAPGSTFKGMFTDPAKYLQYEEGDTCTHDTSLTSTTLQQGQHIYYATEDLTFQDVVDRINCVPFNRIRILYPEPETNTFYSYPEEYYQNTTTVSDPTAVTIKAFHGFIIESSKETLIGGVLSENDPITSGMIHNYPDLYYFVGDIESGWVLIPGRDDINEFKNMLNSLSDRIDKVYAQIAGNYNFIAVPEVNGEYNINFNEDVYFVWIKLAEEPEETTEDCQGDDDDHKCITDGSSPSVFIQTGEEACGTESCLGLEVSCHNIEGEDPTPSWATSSATCTDTTFVSNCAYRAVCGEEQTVYDPNTEYPCGGDDATHVCLTDDGSAYNYYVPDNTIDGRGKIEYFSGETACQTELGLTCVDIEANCQATIDTSTFEDDGNYNGGWDNDFALLNNNNQEVFNAADYSCGNTFETYLEYAPCKWRAVCETTIVEPTIPAGDCGGADATHACVTDESNPAVFIQTGDDACWDIQQYCAGLEVSCHNDPAQQLSEPNWSESSVDCGSQSFDSNCTYRADCYTIQ